MSEQITAPLVVARAAAAAALRVDAVAGLDGGAFGEFATYGSGARCEGVRVRGRDPLEVEVRLTVRYGPRIPDVAEDVRRAVAEDARRTHGAERVVVDVRVTGLAAPSVGAHGPEVGR